MNRVRNAITLHQAARHAIETTSKQHLPMECGGILLGYREDRRVVVTHAISVQASTPATDCYTRDDVQANQLLRTFFEGREAGDPVGYVGEWHSHPAPSLPSHVDVKALRATARSVTSPLVLLVCVPGLEARFAGLIAKRDRFGGISTKEGAVNLPRSSKDELERS